MKTTKLFFILLIAMYGFNVTAKTTYNRSNKKQSATILVLSGYAGATTVGVGQQLEIDAFFIPADQAKALNWSIENTSGEATMETGETHCIITGVAVGTVTIIATTVDDSLTASIDIDVVDSGAEIWVNSILVQGQGGDTSITTKGGTLQMTAVVFPENATDTTFTWSVENLTGSATISVTGLLTAVSDGIVRVKATANDPSKTVGFSDIIIQQASAISDESFSKFISLSPNPASKVLNVSKTNNNPVNLSLINISGKVVKQFNLKNNTNSIDVSDLKRGLYIVVIQLSNHQSFQKKLILN